MTVVSNTGSRFLRDTADESIEAKFGKRVVPMPNGCWAWRGDLTRYGSFSYKGGRHVPTHRFAYEVVHGPIPAGLVLHHKCQNPGCVNPAHLTPLTPGDHMLEHERIDQLRASQPHGR